MVSSGHYFQLAASITPLTLTEPGNTYRIGAQAQESSEYQLNSRTVPQDSIIALLFNHFS